MGTWQRSRLGCLGVVLALVIALLWPVQAGAGGDPTPEEMERLQKAREAGRLPLRVGEGPRIYDHWVKTLFSQEAEPPASRYLADMIRNGRNPYHPVTREELEELRSGRRPEAGGQDGKAASPAKAAVTPAKASQEPEMVPVTQDARKALDWYIWYLREKARKAQEAAAKNPDLAKRAESARNKVERVEKARADFGKSEIQDADLKTDIAKAQADHAKAQAAAASAGGK